MPGQQINKTPKMPVRTERCRPCLCSLPSPTKVSPVHWFDPWSELAGYGDTLLQVDPAAPSMLPSGTGG